MASGGEESFGNRESCSICLEPFRGRDPKMLPCFHTFCLACLSKMAEKERIKKAEQKKVSASASMDEGNTVEGTDEIVISCPSCRKFANVPAEGVKKFQTNFYVDKGDHGRGHVQPIICDVCDQGQVASHCCSICQIKLCFHCHRSHTVCQLAAASAAKTTVGASDEMTKLLKTGKEHLEVISKVLSCAGEEEKELQKQRKSLEDSLHDLYLTGLAQLADARDEVLGKIRSHAKNSEEKLKSEIATVQKTYDVLAHFTSQGDVSSMTEADLRMVLLTDSELKGLQARVEQKTGQFFRFKTDDSGAADLVNSLKELVFGTLELTPVAQDVLAQPTDSGDLDPNLLFGDGTLPSPQVQQNRLLQPGGAEDRKLLLRMDDLAQKFQFTLNKVKESESKEKQLQTEMRSLIEEVKMMQDRNSLLADEVATIQEENKKLREDMTQLQRNQEGRFQDKTGSAKQRSAASAEMTDSPQGSRCQESAPSPKDRLHIEQLQQDVQCLQASVQKTAERTSSIVLLESLIEAALNPIYFKAELDRKVTTNSERPLICKDVLVNKGGGYNVNMGAFCAPVSGTYLFLATAAPFQDDKAAQVDIAHGAWVHGDFQSHGCAYSDVIDCSSSASCVVEMVAGEFVWLRTCSGPATFDKDSMTTFSGVLLMPKVLEKVYEI